MLSDSVLRHSVQGVAFHGEFNVSLRHLVNGVRPCAIIVEAMTECVWVACATNTRLIRFLIPRQVRVLLYLRLLNPVSYLVKVWGAYGA